MELHKLPHIIIFICFCIMFFILYRKLCMKGFLFFFAAFCLMTLRHINCAILKEMPISEFLCKSDEYLYNGITVLEVMGFIILLIELYKLKKNQPKNPFDPSEKMTEDEKGE